MKKTILIIFILIFSVSLVCAADTNGDCTIVLSKDRILSDRDKIEEEDTIKTNLNLAMPKKAMERSFDNLKSYCCDVKKLSDDLCERTNSNVFYPQSVYLFDHILDIYMRRLDAKQQNDNGKDLLYGLDPDGSGLEWRNFITERGNDINGSLPLEMQKQYEKHWQKGIKITPSFMEINGSMQGNWKLDTESAINMYSVWTLFDKYNLACDLSNYITISDGINAQGLNTNEYENCKNLVKGRIDKEKLYVQTILTQKGEKLLGSNMDAYLGTYFVQNKLSGLMQTVFDISTSFSEINKAVARLVPQCS